MSFPAFFRCVGGPEASTSTKARSSQPHGITDGIFHNIAPRPRAAPGSGDGDGAGGGGGGGGGRVGGDGDGNGGDGDGEIQGLFAAPVASTLRAQAPTLDRRAPSQAPNVGWAKATKPRGSAAQAAAAATASPARSKKTNGPGGASSRSTPGPAGFRGDPFSAGAVAPTVLGRVQDEDAAGEFIRRAEAQRAKGGRPQSLATLNMFGVSAALAVPGASSSPMVVFGDPPPHDDDRSFEEQRTPRSKGAASSAPLRATHLSCLIPDYN